MTLRATALRKSYSGISVVEDISLHVELGEEGPVPGLLDDVAEGLGGDGSVAGADRGGCGR